MTAAAAAVDAPLYLAACSFAQERLWFLEQLHPGTPVYNMPLTLRFRSSLERPALERALQTLIARHEALRTSFTAVDGRPRQVIHEQVEFRCHFIDLTSLVPTEREARTLALAAADAAKPFSLEQAPLLRASAIQTGAREFVLQLCVHHIVADGWSMDILVEEITAYFNAYLARQSPNLAPLPIQYADFAAWQREQSDSVLRDGLAYWTAVLSDMPELLDLPTDRLRPPVQSLRGASHPFVVQTGVTAACHAFAASAGATLYQVLLAAFQAFLFRYSGQAVFTVGTPVANRPRREFLNLIGLFINILAIPCRVAAEESFASLVHAVQEQMITALTHQSVPFEQVVEATRPARNLSIPPLFQVMFVLQSKGSTERGLVFEGESTGGNSLPGNGTAKVDLSLLVLEANGQLHCTFEYATDLFEAATIERMGRHFSQLLESLIEAPDRPLIQASMLSAEERTRAIMDWNRTETPAPPSLLLDELFDRAVEAHPQRIALYHGRRSLSYRELDELAAGLAQRLRNQGLRPHLRAAVCLRRTPELIAALLAILKCGATYVPLDPDYPVARNEFMLRDSGASLLVTETLFAHLLAPAGVPMVQVDAQEAPAVETHAISGPRNGQDAAYIIYTSGSTGVPKGVVIRHGSAAHLIGWAGRAFQAAERAGVLAATSVCFDLSVFEIFGTLCCGGTVLLVVNVLDITAAAAAVTLINTVPAAARELLELGLIPKSVRTICLAGEVLSGALVERLYSGTAVTRVLNLYGPTEDTTYSTLAEVPRGTTGAIAIGRPLDNRRAYILDQRMEPVPPGVRGQIYLGGAGVAAGYHGLPELTAQRFLDDPYISGARIFATGDLGRYRADGTIEFLGRLDHQIKLRGFRIETEEVRAALNRQPGVRDSVVMLWQGSDPPALAAYVVPEEGVSPDPRELTAGLREFLPAHMLPSFWMTLPALPLNANGKVDIKRLPPPLPLSQPEPAAARAPGAMEEQVAGIWRDVLNRDPIGVDQGFFDLGGHSLLLTQVASRLQQALGFTIALHEFFEHTTIAAFSRRLQQLMSSDDPSDAPPVRQPGSNDLPLSFAQERLWFLEQFSENHSLYLIPWAYPVSGAFNLAAFDAAMQDLVRRHETLRTRFVAPEGVPIQQIQAELEMDIEYFNLGRLSSSVQSQRLQECVEDFARAPFDLARAPLIRCALVRLSEREHVVLMSLHHIIFDAWSLQILQRDLGRLYEGRLAGKAAELPPLPIQYADFAAWQRRVLHGDRMRRLLSYWRDNLQSAPPFVTFPEDHPRPPVQTYQGSTDFFSIDASLKSHLAHLAREESTTLYVVSLAAFAYLLAQYSGEAEVSIGTPISGRHHPGTENVIGFFVNTVVIHARVDPQATFRALLRAVRAKVLEAYDHQDAPFEKIVEALQPERTLRYSPLFQIMFGFQALLEPQRQKVTPAQGVTPAPEDSGTGAPQIRPTTSKFDMTFSLTDSQQAISGAVEFNTGLYRPETVARITANYVTVLRELAANADRLMGATRACAVGEYNTLVHEFNRNSGEPPVEASLHQLFAQQARRTPGSPALIYGAIELSYAALDAWSDDWACELESARVGAGHRVALTLNRGLEAVVAFLAIWKTGAAVVPLDAGAPDARLENLLRDADPVAVIGHRGRPLAVEPGVVWLSVEELAVGSRRLQSRPHDPHSLAYIIFTSGSTGRPKGVAVEHAAAVNLINAMLQRVYSRYKDSFPLAGTLNAPLFFDGAIERLGMLLQGHALHLIPDPMRHDPAELTRYVRAHRIDVLDFTPSHLTHLIDQGLLDDSDYRPRAVIIGGEAINAALWKRLAALQDSDIFNVYGPTECTVNATACRVSESPEEPSIGRPLLNTRVYVLDPNRQPVPLGVIGEIYLAGAGLAREYWGQTELTAERFVTVDLEGIGPQRLYRTGDRGRWLANGQLQYSGRIDSQLKIQGYRIEPEEIVAALSKHHGVRQAAVIAREDGNGNTRLVAYVVPREGARVDVQELRALARRELPGYMVPGLIQGVEALPLTPSGKLDARALPALETSRPQLDVALVPARSATEKSIAACWAGVLGVEELGIHDNFFELGGYSLLAIQVIARLKQSLGVELSPRDLFEKPTIAELAELVMGRLGAGGVAQEAPLEIVAGGIEQFSDSEVADLLQQMLVPPT